MKCLEITTNIGCINNCVYCPQDKLLSAYPQDGKRVLELANYKDILKRIPKHVKIHFSGFSEPFLNLSCLSMIQHTLKTGRQVGLYTTTIGMNEHTINQLLGLEIKPFMVHLVDRNLEECAKNARMMEEVGVEFEYIKVGNYPESSLEQRLYMRTTRKINYQIEIGRAGNLEWHGENDIKGPIRCRDNRQFQNVLLPNGDIILCCQDYSLEYKLGNIYHDKYSDLHKGRKFLDILAQMRERDNDLICRKCFRAVPV